MPTNYLLFFALILLLGACTPSEQRIEWKFCKSFPGRNPHLSVTNSQLGLTYVTLPYGYDTTAVAFTAEWMGGRYTVPHFLEEQFTPFVNWADFPSARYSTRTANQPAFGFHHYLRYSGVGTYDYDIVYTFWNDSVRQENQILHTDGVAAEHGFLSSAPLPGGRLQVTWLDGRNTKLGAAAGAVKVSAEQPATDGHSHTGGAMTLRTRTLPDSGSVELDHRVCDCCNTATVATAERLMVVYRDRSEHEIRDIAYVTRPIDDTNWSTPKLVHADNWEMAGCPVNGPALAANSAGDIAVSWYTAASDLPRIQFARYDVSSDRFSSPIVLDDNNPLGRLNLALADDGTAYVSGLTTTPGQDSATLTLWTIDATDHVSSRAMRKLSPSRQTGFPQLALLRDTLHFAYNLVEGEHIKVETAILPR